MKFRPVYAFIMYVLEQVSAQDEFRGVSGQELCGKFIELCQKEFGAFSPFILEEWGIGSSEDLGKAIKQMVKLGVLKKEKHDRYKDFGGRFVIKDITFDMFPITSTDRDWGYNEEHLLNQGRNAR